MKIVISYKQTWVDENELIRDLNFIKDILVSVWHNVFIFFLDIDKDKTEKEIINIVKSEIESCDMVISFINHKDKSEWMLLELWIARWLNKNITIIIKEEYYKNYFLIYWLTNNIIKFNSLNWNFKDKLLKNI